MVIREDNYSSDSEPAKSLSNRAAIAMKAISDSTVLVSFADHVEYFTFPFPVHGEKCKTRVSRKSLYIEVECPIRSYYENTLDLSLDPFKIDHEGESVTLLNVHYVKLEGLPVLQLPKPSDELTWLSIHLALSLSESEGNIQKLEDQRNHGVLLNIKEKIDHIFHKYSLSNEHNDIFALANASDGVGIYALIFVNDVKLDLGSQTVVMDAHMVPFNDEIAHKVPSLLQKAREHGLSTLFTPDPEARAWKLLLPTLAERCRTWKHSERCEYKIMGIASGRRQGKILCSCGKGKNLQGSFAMKSEWEPFHGEATRIALSPLFAFASMDIVSQGISRVLANNSKSSAVDPKCAKCGSSGQPTPSSCSICKTVKYCSRACQKADWRSHKLHCRVSKMV